MKTSMAAETPHNRTCTRFPIRPRSLSLSLSFFLRPGRDCENHQNPNRVLSPWLKGERGKLGDEEAESYSLFLSTRAQCSCGDRAYLTYGGPAFGIIYGREGSNRSQKKRCPRSVPTSLHRLWIAIESAKTWIAVSRGLDRERVYALGRVEFVNGHTSVVSNNVSKIGWNNLGRS